MDTLKIIESLSAKSLACDAPKISETKEGVHILKSAESRLSKSGNQTVEINWTHKYNPDMSIKDFLRFSSYPDFKRSLERVRHAVNNLSRTDSYLQQYFENGDLPVLEEFYTASDVAGQEPTLQFFDIDNLAISQSVNHDKKQTAKLRYDKKREIDASLDEGYSLIVVPDTYYTVEFETIMIEDKPVKIAKNVKYLAVRIIKDRVVQFANKFAEILNTLQNKEVNIKLQENSRGFQEISKYTKVV